MKLLYPTGQGETAYRDLNKNGRLDPYEDPRQPLEMRVEDLLRQMTLAEKVGLMFQTFIGFGMDEFSLEGDDLAATPAGQMVTSLLLNHFNFPNLPDPRTAAAWQNAMQKLAEGTRLGIPITFVSDPCHAFSNNPAVSAQGGKFSRWPEPIGLAAIGDEKLVQEFADIARQEYLAIGIRVALHPMADLATEPRWARINGTFGEDAALASRMVEAYICGFQGEQLGPHSVACMTKHFPGGGPQKDGEDPHFAYGREQVYPGNNFAYHLLPFEAAFRAGSAQIMPYYGMPVGTPYEAVGFSYNKAIITDLLRKKYQFKGVVCTDYGLVTDMNFPGFSKAACAWGVEHLSIPERVKMLIEAGIDILGGESCPEVILDLVTTGQISEARIDESARRILRDKFRLGLFDNPFVDLQTAESVVGKSSFVTAGAQAQRRAMVLLKNGAAGGKTSLPLAGRPRIYAKNMDPAVVNAYGQITQEISQADLAILRLNTPYQPRTGNFLERMFHAGDLDFKGEEKARILAILKQKQTIVVMHLDRPAVIPEINEHCAALLGEFGASDAAVLDVIFGLAQPEGKLPFELPASMDAVRKQDEDVPYDSHKPIYPFGFGLSY